MDWFASWRPKFRKVVACTMIISALASAGSKIQDLEYYSLQQAKVGYSEILDLKQIKKRNENVMNEVGGMLTEAANMKSYAEKLSKEGKTEESKEVYRKLLKKDERIVEILTRPGKLGFHIALAKNDIIIIKNKLKGNKFFDVNRVDIRGLEEDIYNAWVEVDKLTKSVSNEVQEVERILGIIN